MAAEVSKDSVRESFVLRIAGIPQSISMNETHILAKHNAQDLILIIRGNREASWAVGLKINDRFKVDGYRLRNNVDVVSMRIIG